MYQRQQTNNTDIKPKTRNEAIIEIVGMFAVNWPRYDNDSWPQQMAKLLRASFKTTHPNTIIKAGWHVLQKMTDDYPPSMGKIVKCMESFIGSGAAKSPKAEQCDKCNAGFILVSFWMIQSNVSYQQSVQCACDCDYGKKRQSSLGAVPFKDFIALNVNHPHRYIGNKFETWQKDLGLWVQGETYKIDEIPTYDEDTVRNSSKDLPFLSYNEIGLDETIKQRRQQLHIGESREQRAERLSNIGVEMQKAIKQLATKMAIPVPNDFEQLEHDDDSISDDSTEDMPKTNIDHQQQQTHDIQEETKQTFDDEIDWSWHT